ncbi:MAG TPA: Hsp20/alpha crystallin family protein [Puia sp.]|nr:Hsp20/alpha crystallin family protein [Puia sp.]
MTLVKRNGNLIPSVPTFFDDFLNRDIAEWNRFNFSGSGATMPAVNIKENKDAFEVEMAAPGMTKKDFTIELEGNQLTITAEKNTHSEEKDGDRFTRREFSYQSFERSFNLAKEVVDGDHIKAKYEDGILKLVIPKKEEAKQKQHKLIQVS